MQQAVHAFIWFLWLCLTPQGLGLILFWLPFLCALPFMLISFSESPPDTRRRFWWLALLPLCWIAVGLWGGYFWVDAAPGRFRPNPGWVDWPILYGLPVFLIASAVLVFRARHGRIFAGLFALANLYLMLGMTFLAGMATSGTWL